MDKQAIELIEVASKLLNQVFRKLENGDALQGDVQQAIGVIDNLAQKARQVEATKPEPQTKR